MLEQIVEALVGVGDFAAELFIFLRSRFHHIFYAGDVGLANFPNGFYANISGLYLRTELRAHVLNNDPNNTYGYSRKRAPRQEILNCHGGFQLEDLCVLVAADSNTMGKTLYPPIHPR